MSIVSNNIKYLRRLNGLTQEQFARRIGIKRPSVGAYEEARAHPPYDTLISMAKLFSVTVDQLIKTDLRKVRETPDLGLAPSPSTPPPVSRPPVAPSPEPVQPRTEFRPEPRPETRTEAVRPIAAVVEKYYRDDRTQIRLVAQRVMFKRVSAKTPSRPVEAPSIIRPALSSLPSFNTNYEATNGRPVAVLPQSARVDSQSIPLVYQNVAEEYARRFRDSIFLDNLPSLPVPLLPSGGLYRAFEAGTDFAFPGASLIGKYVANWYDLEDARHYVLVIQGRGTWYRRVYNQVKIKGTLLLSADDPALASQEISIKDVLEAWEVKAFLSYELPKPSLPVDRLRGLVAELQEELNRG